MNNILKTAPAVFAVGDSYQITVPVRKKTTMWVKIGDKSYSDHSNGILRSAKGIHKISVPCEELDRAGRYTVCYRQMVKRKPYFSVTKDVQEESFDFYPANGEKLVCYHISDAHNMVEEPVAAAKRFEKENGKLDFLILNGDVPEDSSKIKHFDTIYEIVGRITGGNIPTIFSRGNHDTRGVYAENIAEFTPCDNGNSYFTFRLGKLWGIVIDCGEDKPDTNKEYGNTVCCSEFRRNETAFIENVIKNDAVEYNAEGVEQRIVICHNPFTRRYNPPFNIEEDTFSYWARLLKENVKPDVMICGHIHKFSVDKPGCDNDDLGQPCTVVVGSRVNKHKGEYAGSGFVFNKSEIEVVFNDGNEIIERHII